MNNADITVSLDWTANSWSRVAPVDRGGRPAIDVWFRVLFVCAPVLDETVLLVGDNAPDAQLLRAYGVHLRCVGVGTLGVVRPAEFVRSQLAPTSRVLSLWSPSKSVDFKCKQLWTYSILLQLGSFLFNLGKDDTLLFLERLLFGFESISFGFDPSTTLQHKIDRDKVLWKPGLFRRCIFELSCWFPTQVNPAKASFSVPMNQFLCVRHSCFGWFVGQPSRRSYLQTRCNCPWSLSSRVDHSTYKSRFPSDFEQ